MKFQDIYIKHQDEEFLQFDRIKDKLSSRPDIHAFMLLNQLVPGNRDMVVAAEHDEIWLDVDMETFEATEQQCIDLIRCGVRFDVETDSMAMFV